MTISGILIGRFYFFLVQKDMDVINQERKSSMVENTSIDNQLITKFKINLTSVLTSNPDFKNDLSKSISIETLSTFSFPLYQENLPLFVKDTILLFLDHSNHLIRLSVA